MVLHLQAGGLEAASVRSMSDVAERKRWELLKSQGHKVNP
jgi:hypothetical protein